MICKHCGMINEDGVNFCQDCGRPLVSTLSTTISTPAAAISQVPADIPVQPDLQEPTPQANTSITSPEGKPISAWGYYGYKLLFSIPIAGFILLIVFSCGVSSNVNLRNFARSYWCELLVVSALTALSVLICLAFGIGFDFLNIPPLF